MNESGDGVTSRWQQLQTMLFGSDPTAGGGLLQLLPEFIPGRCDEPTHLSLVAYNATSDQSCPLARVQTPTPGNRVDVAGALHNLSIVGLVGSEALLGSVVPFVDNLDGRWNVVFLFTAGESGCGDRSQTLDEIVTTLVNERGTAVRIVGVDPPAESYAMLNAASDASGRALTDPFGEPLSSSFYVAEDVEQLVQSFISFVPDPFVLDISDANTDEIVSVTVSSPCHGTYELTPEQYRFDVDAGRFTITDDQAANDLRNSTHSTLDVAFP
jgi:hypothetical protein